MAGVVNKDYKILQFFRQSHFLKFDTINTMKNNDNLYKVINIMRVISFVLLVIGGVGLLASAYPILKSEFGFEIKQRIEAANNPEVVITQAPNKPTFGTILIIPPALGVEPINTTNSIIITKIDVNSPIVWDVDVMNNTAYNNALKTGVAHAAETAYPSDHAGNTYLFAHSTLNPLDIERYAAEFTLLHRLEINDKITVYYEGKRYDYLVISKEVVNKFNTEPLTREPDFPMLTLQTCDPPGVPLNRLIITAKLAAVY